MAAGLFILLNDKEALINDVKYGFYGFLMPPIYEEEPNSRSRHYAALSDYACCEKGTEIFFFMKRTITYGGVIKNSNENNPVFYLNGDSSHIGRRANSELYLNAKTIYDDNEGETKKGIYHMGKNQRGEDIERAMPYIIEFDNTSELTGKQISSDELYFELGNYNFPFPSNTIQGKGMCTLTPKETKILKKLLKESTEKLDFKTTEDNIIIYPEKKTIFNNKFVIMDKFTNESHLEFTLLANKVYLNHILKKAFPEIKNYNFIKGRQIPLCPFKPMQYDAADICLYDSENPIKENSLPNIIIELKKDAANYTAYAQVARYLRWVKQCAPQEFDKVRCLIIAPQFKSNLNKDTLMKKNVTLEFNDKIKLYSIDNDEVTTVE